jgi:hypothetical protein
LLYLYAQSGAADSATAKAYAKEIEEAHREGIPVTPEELQAPLPPPV